MSRSFAFVIVIVTTNFITSVVFSQDFNLGIRYSYGTIFFKHEPDGRITEKFNTNRIAVVTEFSPYLSRLLVTSGIEYEMYDLGRGMNFPLNMRIVFGNKVRPFIEGGGYFSYPLKNNSHQYALKSDAGARVGTGLLYYFNKRWRGEIGYSYRFGLSTALEEEILLPLYQVSIEKYRKKSGGIDISLKYRF